MKEQAFLSYDRHKQRVIAKKHQDLGKLWDI